MLKILDVKLFGVKAVEVFEGVILLPTLPEPPKQIKAASLEGHACIEPGAWNSQLLGTFLLSKLPSFFSKLFLALCIVVH